LVNSNDKNLATYVRASLTWSKGKDRGSPCLGYRCGPSLHQPDIRGSYKTTDTGPEYHQYEITPTTRIQGTPHCVLS